MSRFSFWTGIVAGAAGTAVGLWSSGLLIPLNSTVHVDRSIQIDRPAADVFAACARIERLPRLIRSVVSVTSCDDVSVWQAFIDGHSFEWDVEIVQVVPKQMIGWKSYKGPRHSGQIRFFPVGDKTVAPKTLVQVEMNYVQGLPTAHHFGRSFSGSLGTAIEAALRDLRTVLESAHPHWTAVPPVKTHETVRKQATGTYGSVFDSSEPENSEGELQSSGDIFQRPPTGDYS